MEKITNLVSGEFTLQWVIVAFLVGYFLYKEWPGFRDRVKAWGKHEATQETAHETIEKRVGTLESHVVDINQKLDRDFSRLNEIADSLRLQQKASTDSLEERELIMRSILAVLKGLQEIGANGPTKEAQADIETYLNKQAHEPAHKV